MINKKKKNISVVMAGHVDHGKSTVLGRMLADADALPSGKLEKVKATCERNSKPFEYAFLIDALKEEQSQGITIDSARVFFKTKTREYIIIDAPGHIDFLKNMVTGAARAEAAVLVIDAAEGVKENSKRHGLLLSMLGVEQIAVVVNKMDLVSYNEKKFKSIADEYTAFLDKINIKPVAIIPVSGIEGGNIVQSGKSSMPWYKGKTVLEILDLFETQKEPVEKPFRMPVQGVYKFTRFSDDRRIIAGTVEAGKISVGDEILFYPSGKKSTVKTIEAFNSPTQKEVQAGEAAGFTLTEQIYVARGEVAISHQEPLPDVTSRIKVSLFWLGKKPMRKGSEYIFKLGTAKVIATLESIEKTFDASDLDSDMKAEEVRQNTLAECVIKLKRPIALDLVGNFQKTSRFVIVDEYDISGGGIIREALEDEQSWVREKVLLRNYKWIKSMIPHPEREKKHFQQSALIFITGKQGIGRKTIAKQIESDLFKEGRLVYFLGIGNVLYGVDADIKGISDSREEHLRRLAEISHLMLDAGMILIVTAIELTKEDMDIIKPAIGPDKVETIWVGSKVTTDVEYDLKIDDPKDLDKSVALVKDMLKQKQIIQ